MLGKHVIFCQRRMIHIDEAFHWTLCCKSISIWRHWKVRSCLLWYSVNFYTLILLKLKNRFVIHKVRLYGSSCLIGHKDIELVILNHNPLTLEAAKSAAQLQACLSLQKSVRCWNHAFQQVPTLLENRQWSSWKVNILT